MIQFVVPVQFFYYYLFILIKIIINGSLPKKSYIIKKEHSRLNINSIKLYNRASLFRNHIIGFVYVQTWPSSIKNFGTIILNTENTTSISVTVGNTDIHFKGIVAWLLRIQKRNFLWQVKQKRYFNMSYGFQSKQKRSVNLDNKEHAIRT